MSDFHKDFGKLKIADPLSIAKPSSASASANGRTVVNESGPILMSPGGTMRQQASAASTTSDDEYLLTEGIEQSEHADSMDHKWSTKEGVEFKLTRDLFGGSITMDLMEDFEDVSDIRPIPDHQEVFVDKLSDSSLIVELLNFEDTISNAKAASFYFDDLAQCNEAESTKALFNSAGSTMEGLLPNIDASFYRGIIIGKQSIRKKSSSTGEDHIEDIYLFLVVIRLQSVGTDVLITMNLPSQVIASIDKEGMDWSIFKELGKSDAEPSFLSRLSTARAEMEDGSCSSYGGRLPLDAIHVFQLALRTFNIKNWALFA